MESQLFVAMTKPPEFFGVDSEFCLMAVVTIFLVFAMTGNIFYCLLYVPFHLIGYVECRKDKYYFKVLLKRVLECRFTPNKRFWGVQCYEPY